MEMEFTMISAPQRSYITPEKTKTVPLKKYSQKERAPGLSMPTLSTSSNRRPGKKGPSSKRPITTQVWHASVEEHFSLQNTCSSTLPHLKGERDRPGTSSTNNLIQSNTKMKMTQVSPLRGQPEGTEARCRSCCTKANAYRVALARNSENKNCSALQFTCSALNTMYTEKKGNIVWIKLKEQTCAEGKGRDKG